MSKNINLSHLIGKTVGREYRFGKYSPKEFKCGTKKKLVFKGVHPDFNINICIKAYKPPVASTSFLGEINNLKVLTHPNIEQIFDRGVEGKWHYLISRWRDIDYFRELIDYEVKFSLDEIEIISRTLLGALHYSDKKGIPHTDAKAENFGLDIDESLSLEERVYIGDFEPWYKGEWGPGQRDYKIRNHVSGTALVIEELLNNRKNPEIEVPKGFMNVVKKAKEMKYESPGEFKIALENYQKAKITRRRFIKWGAIGAAVCTVGGLGYLGYLGNNHINSIDYIVDEIKKVNATDYKNIDPLFKELKFRIFDQKIRSWIEDKKIPKGEFPFGTMADGGWYTSKTCNFYNGSLPGILWEGYKITQDQKFLEWASERTADIKIVDSDSDYVNAFRFLHSHAKGYDITGDNSYKKIALKALDLLAQKFNNIGKFIPIDDEYSNDGGLIRYSVPFFLWGYKVTNNERYSQIAIEHTYTSIKANIREDGSVRSTAIFDPLTYEVVGEKNSKGISGSSTLSRSQAQMFFGLVEAYEFTKDPIILDAAEKVFNYFSENLPDDCVPPFDFQAPKKPETPKDSSSTSISLPGSLKLSKLTNYQIYSDRHRKMKKSLTLDYLSTDLENHHGILTQACHNAIKKQYTNCSLISGDHHFLIS